MCGIYGFVGRDNSGGSSFNDYLLKMGERLQHRGPDALHKWAGENVAMGMSRLSIIDLQSGVQPFWNQSKTVTVVFNGEIYNHRELRSELEEEGVRFSSDHADGEVIVHLYEKIGLDFVQKIRGMFGIAIWDNRNGEIHLVRDRAGIKPVFYYHKAKNFAFASEIKALFELPWISKAPSLSGLSTYFSNKNVCRPETAYQDIYELPAGNILTFSTRNKSVYIDSYWSACPRIDNEKTREDWVEIIRSQFVDSVISHTESDVEYGAYLSGGVDSSAVVGALVANGGQKLKTFTLVYQDESVGKKTDREFAQKVAKKYGTDHYEHYITSSDIVENLDNITDSFDEPFSGVFSTYFLSELISRHVKVALSGDGADELFGSYFFHRIANTLRDGKISNSKSLEQLVALGLGETQAKSLLDSNGFLESRYQWGVFGEAELNRFLVGELKGAFESKIEISKMKEHSYSSMFFEDPLNESLLYDFNNLLPDQVLTFVDRLSMAHSLEVRPPFLDHKMIELAFQVPGKYKIEGTRVKSVLKDALEPFLIPEITNRPKEGFVLPMNQWFETDLVKWKDSIVNASRIDKIGLFNGKAVMDTLNSHKSNSNEYGKRVLNLLMFILWWEKNFE